MKVAFWNINTGITSFSARRKTFKEWCQWAKNTLKLDLLILEEVGHTFFPELEEYSGMSLIGHVNTLDKNLNSSTKSIASLINTEALECAARTLRRTKAKGTKRAALKVVVSPKSADEDEDEDEIDKTIYVWGIHANASPLGGRTNASEVVEHLHGESGKYSVIGGDFNHEYDKMSRTIESKRYQDITIRHPQIFGKKANCTQWRKESNPENYISEDWHVPMDVFTSHWPVKGRVIDYIAHGDGIHSRALNNCGDPKIWREILMQFDHCPVVYELQTEPFRRGTI